MASSDPLHLNAELVVEVLTRFIRSETTKVGFERVVLGLSGGIDSALAAHLAVRALGRSNVRAVAMPYRTSSVESRTHARLVADSLGIALTTEEITAMVDGYAGRGVGDEHRELGATRRGNLMARMRMAVLYDQSVEFGALVLGTSNKTELLLGYGTQHGDLASALNPLGDLYKTQVRQLSRHVGVPREVIEKAPSADLWEGQSDEADLGFTYDAVDALLVAMIDERRREAELLAMGFSPALVFAVRARIQGNHFKRKPPILAKISARTLDQDFHYLRDWGK